MAYKYKERYLKVGSPWIDDDGIQHPYNWATSWSADDLKKWNITVEADEDNSFDSRFYSSKGVEKSLSDTYVTDLDGNVLKDEDGNNLLNVGLKNYWINQTKKRANELLFDSDWYVVRKADIGEAIPSDIDTYRKAVRTAAASIDTKINACSDLAALKALFDIPEGKTKAPMYDWPDEVS
jgi:hypothetical protein